MGFVQNIFDLTLGTTAYALTVLATGVTVCVIWENPPSYESFKTCFGLAAFGAGVYFVSNKIRNTPLE